MDQNDQRDGQASLPLTLSQESLQIMLAIGKLAETVVAKAPAKEIDARLATLIERIGAHFAHEERAMDEADYAGRRWHKIVHADILNELKLAACRSTENASAIDRDFLIRIRSIFIQHADDDDIFKAAAKLGLLMDALPEVPAADLADVLEGLDHDQRLTIFNQLDKKQASDILEEVEPAVQRALASSLSVERVAELVDDMTPAPAADFLAGLAVPERDAILLRIDAAKAGKVRALLARPGEHALNYATARFIAVPPSATVGESIGKYGEQAETATVAMYLYVTSSEGVLLGVVDVRDLLLADFAATLADIMTGHVIALGEDETLAAAAKLFARYGLSAVPVVGDGGILKGVILARDIRKLNIQTN